MIMSYSLAAQVYLSILLLKVIYLGLSLSLPSAGYGNLLISGGDVKFFNQSTKSLRWPAASAVCRQNGLRLASVGNQDVQQLIVDYFRKQNISSGSYWIGGSGSHMRTGNNKNSGTENANWFWQDSHPLNDGVSTSKTQGGDCAFANFDAAEPQLYSTAADCLARKPFICSRCASASAECFVVVRNVSLSWFDARFRCGDLEKTGDLAVYKENRTKQILIRKLLTLAIPSDTNYWVGITQIKWEWPDKEPVKFNKFSNSQVPGCLAISSAGSWVPQDCSAEKQFICAAVDEVALVESNFPWTYLAVAAGACFGLIILIALLGCYCSGCCRSPHSSDDQSASQKRLSDESSSQRNERKSAVRRNTSIRDPRDPFEDPNDPFVTGNDPLYGRSSDLGHGSSQLSVFGRQAKYQRINFGFDSDSAFDGQGSGIRTPPDVVGLGHPSGLRPERDPEHFSPGMSHVAPPRRDRRDGWNEPGLASPLHVAPQQTRRVVDTGNDPLHYNGDNRDSRDRKDIHYRENTGRRDNYYKDRRDSHYRDTTGGRDNYYRDRRESHYRDNTGGRDNYYRDRRESHYRDSQDERDNKKRSQYYRGNRDFRESNDDQRRY